MARHALDTSGLKCPLPVLKAEKYVETLAPGEELEILTTDPVSVIDIPHFCRSHGHTLIRSWNDGNTFGFALKVGPEA